MVASSGKFDIAGAEIFYRQWQPEADTRAVVLLVHGLAEHSGRYGKLAEQMNAAGYAVCALDLPGHGRSAGEPGYIASFDQYRDAVLALRARLGQQYPGLPVFLLGHSMGGLVSALAVGPHQSQFAGLILSAAAIQTPLPPPPLQVFVVRLLSQILPHIGVMQLSPAEVSRDPAVVQDYIDDPLNHTGKLSARLVVELFANMQSLQQQASGLTLPLLILHGSADAMTSVAGSRQLHQLAQSADKTLTVYDGLYHEIFNEPEGPEIVAGVVAWLRQRDSR